MPAKNSIKPYIANSYYHIYNRGVEKRKIFMDKEDIGVFLSYLKEYLLPKDENYLKEKLADSTTTSKEKDKIIKKLRLNNFSDEMTLLCYSLMPNHFHFFVRQKSSNSIDRFMQSLGTRYTAFFNKRYKRVGSLFQAVYKAVLVQNEEQFIYLSKYIHKQALIANYACSYMDYIKKRNTEWVKPEEILSYFSDKISGLTYKSFIQEEDDYDSIRTIMLEDPSECFSFAR